MFNISGENEKRMNINGWHLRNSYYFSSKEQNYFNIIYYYSNVCDWFISWTPIYFYGILTTSKHI
jgi:hypothetical protein